jgi:peptidyl-prolyl cis-trans isomerase SurA
MEKKKEKGRKGLGLQPFISGSLYFTFLIGYLPLALFFALTGLVFGGGADSIAAIVGNRVVLESEVRQLMTYVRLSSGDTLTPDSILRFQALRRLVDEALLQDQAEKESIDVSRDEVQTAVQENINSIKERFESGEEFLTALEAEGLTERLLKERIGEEVRRNLLARRLLEKSGLTEIYVSPAEAEAFYNQHKDSIARVPGRVELAHILIAIKPLDSTENAARARAWEVLDLLSRGGDFATLARSFSDDRKTSIRGGDWGWVEKESLFTQQPELKIVLEQLKPGQTSPPFRSRQGYIILRKLEESAEQVRFRSILIAIPLTRADTTRARNRANSVRRQALDGIRFDSLAMLYSDDPETGKEGGYLGEFLLEGLAPPFDRAISQLNTGDISEPILSEHGFHIIKVINKEPSRLLTFPELQEAIRNYIYQQRFTERLRSYLDRLEQKVYVEIK